MRRTASKHCLPPPDFLKQCLQQCVSHLLDHLTPPHTQHHLGSQRRGVSRCNLVKDCVDIALFPVEITSQTQSTTAWIAFTIALTIHVCDAKNKTVQRPNFLRAFNFMNFQEFSIIHKIKCFGWLGRTSEIVPSPLSSLIASKGKLGEDLGVRYSHSLSPLVCSGAVVSAEG